MKTRNTLVLPSCDINGDGRLDYLVQNGKGDSWALMIQQPDGTFVEEFMQTMSKSDYETNFDPTSWASTEVPPFMGLSSGSGNTGAIFSGASLAKKPPLKAPGMGLKVNTPTKVIDLNNDGRLDLVDEGTGTLYYNMGQGKWIVSKTGGAIYTTDLNNDGIQDFIYPGTKLQTVVYKGNGEFETNVLYENIQVDKQMYCYDFDNDGDVDILVTFSAPSNSTGFTYTMFFKNKGDGTFVQQEEQDYGTNKLYFSNLQDIDGDGYYDLLAFNGPYAPDRDGFYWQDCTTADVYWLRGKSDMTFEDPALLYAVSEPNGLTGWFSDIKINAEDIDNDGICEVWISGFTGLSSTIVHKVSPATANNAPTAPAKPQLRYENGLLMVTWGNGTDDKTSTADLSYAIRIGTTSGGCEIVRPQANSDGTRRNFLDGNRGKYHDYTIDLRSYEPATIYVAVQTIDAQHRGSVWSTEATIAHTIPPATFSISDTIISVGKPCTISGLTTLPATYTHSWNVQDGVERSGSITFATAGKKIVTHTVTAPDGTSSQYSVTVEVLPNSIDATRFFTSDQRYIYTDLRLIGVLNGKTLWSLADYNADGYWDAAYNNVINKGVSSEPLFVYVFASSEPLFVIIHIF